MKTYPFSTRLDSYRVAEFAETDEQVVDLCRRLRRKCEVEGNHLQFSPRSSLRMAKKANMQLCPIPACVAEAVKCFRVSR